MAKFCTSCGTQASDDQSFCSACGVSFNQKMCAGSKTPDFVGKPLSKKSQKPLWIIAAVAQLVCLVMFFLPTLNVTVSIPYEYAEDIPYVSDFVEGNSENEEHKSSLDGFLDPRETQTPESVDILEGNFKIMNVIDFFGTEAYQTICLLLVIISFAFFILPLIKGQELKVQNALFALVAQGLFFVVNIITLLVLKGKPVSLIKKLADMIVITEVPEFIIDLICDTVESFYTYRLNVLGWLYMAFSVIAIGMLCVLVIYNRKELKRSSE